MSVTCGVNSEAEAPDHPMFTCHHCGMPVCEQHGWVITADDAFDDARGRQPRDPADHAAASRAAMHCLRCADEFHKGTDRHHGWADPRPQPARAPGRT